jgi:hypothetical protein
VEEEQNNSYFFSTFIIIWGNSREIIRSKNRLKSYHSKNATFKDLHFQIVTNIERKEKE